MNEIIEKIYELKFSHLTTPLNLVENALLENYEYVKYYTEEEKLIVEMKCKNLMTFDIFYYYFNKENKLVEIILEHEDGIKELKFSRQMELEKLLEEYTKINSFQKTS